MERSVAVRPAGREHYQLTGNLWQRLGIAGKVTDYCEKLEQRLGVG